MSSMNITVGQAKLHVKCNLSFVKLQIGSQKFQTKENDSLQFNEQFKINLGVGNEILKVTLMESLPQKRTSQIIGEAMLTISEVKENKLWIPLYSNSQDAGSIELHLDLPQNQQQPKQDLQKQSSIKYNSIDFESQWQDLEARCLMIQNNSYQGTIKYLDEESGISEMVMAGLRHLRQTDPEDQLLSLSNFFLQYK